MKLNIQMSVMLVLAMLWLVGCSHNSQTFIGPAGDLKNCASYGEGLIPIMLASGRFSDCVEDLKRHGYKEVDATGALGIVIDSVDSTGLKIRKVYDDSPAAIAGIVKTDIIVAINGKKATHRGDFDISLGPVGGEVALVVERSGKEMTYNLKRAQLYYSKVLEDVTFR